jgi:hypothetical protein
MILIALVTMLALAEGPPELAIDLQQSMRVSGPTEWEGHLGSWIINGAFINGAVTPDGQRVFATTNGVEYYFYGRDGVSFRGEKVHVFLDLRQATMRAYTTSQSKTYRVPGKQATSTGSEESSYESTYFAPIPLAALSDSKLLVGLKIESNTSGNFAGVSLIDFKARGPSPNQDASFPTDLKGTYKVVHLTVREDGVLLLVGHGLGDGSKRVRFEAHLFADGKLKRLSKGEAGPYAKVCDKTVTYSGSLYLSDVDPVAGALIRTGEGLRFVDIGSGRTWNAPRKAPLSAIRFLGGRVYANSYPEGSNPRDKHLYRLDGDVAAGMGKWTDLGPYSLVGTTPDEKAWALQSSKTKDLWIVVPK